MINNSEQSENVESSARPDNDSTTSQTPESGRPRAAEGEGTREPVGVGSDEARGKGNSVDLVDAASSVAGHLVRLLSDHKFRRDLRWLAQAILDAVPETDTQPETSTPANSTLTTETDLVVGQAPECQEPSADQSPDTATMPAECKPPVDVRDPLPSIDYLPAQEALEMLQLGGRMADDHGFTEPEEVAPLPRISLDEELNQYRQQLKLIADRCQLKAEAAAWAGQRKRLMEQDASKFASQIEPRDREIIARAKTFEHCFLWTNHPMGPEPLDLGLYDSVANSFEMLSASAQLVHRLLDLEPGQRANQIDSTLLLEAMQLMAEAQSALRVAVVTIEYGFDPDQREAFHLLQRMTQQFGILSRFMKTTDTASPESYQRVLDDIRALEERLGNEQSRERDRRNLISKIKYEVGRTCDRPEQFVERSQKIIDAVCQLTQDGIPPSNVELRESVLPLIDRFEELDSPLPDEMARFLREVDRFLASHPSQDVSPPTDNYSDDVERVAEVLRGKKMLMIGGERRPLKQEAIRAAFDLEELIWDTTHDHTSLDRMIPGIRRDDVSIVLLAIRWSSHSYSELDGICEQLGKIFVRLPGGTSPNQIAHHIVEQAGKRIFS